MSEIALAPVQLPVLTTIVFAFWWVPAVRSAGGSGAAFVAGAILAVVLPMLAAGFAYGHRHGIPSPFTMLLGFGAAGWQIWLWLRLRDGQAPAGAAEAILWNHGPLYAGAAWMAVRGVLVRASPRIAQALDGEYAEFLKPGP